MITSLIFVVAPSSFITARGINACRRSEKFSRRDGGELGRVLDLDDL